MKHLALGLTLATSLLSTGCNFFGKEEPKATASTSYDPVPAELAGTWSYIDVGTAPNNTPEDVFFTRYTFNDDGEVELEYNDMLSGGVQTRVQGPLVYSAEKQMFVMSFRTGVDPLSSFIGYGMALYNVELAAKDFLFYSLSSTGSRKFLFKGDEKTGLPVGVWRFNGEFGIDFLVIAETGYAVIQTRDSGNNALLIDAKVEVSTNGGLSLIFFDGTPSEEVSSLEFDRYSFNTTSLELEAGSERHTGTKL